MPKDPNAEFFKDVMKAFEDLPPEHLAEFRRYAAELGIPTVELCWIACAEYIRRRRRQRKS